MSRVSVSELKANLSRYLQEVRRGGEVQILHRGVPVARLSRLPTDGNGDDGGRDLLIQGGVLRPGTGGATTVAEAPLLELGLSLSEALDEERDDRL